MLIGWEPSKMDTENGRVNKRFNELLKKKSLPMLTPKLYMLFYGVYVQEFKKNCKRSFIGYFGNNS